MSDLKFINGDIDLTNGALTLVSDDEAAAQDIKMTLATCLRETPYDRSAGVPYLQVIFGRHTTNAARRFIIERQILARPAVDQVLELDIVIDRVTREGTITGKVLLKSGNVIPLEQVIA